VIYTDEMMFRRPERTTAAISSGKPRRFPAIAAGLLVFAACDRDGPEQAPAQSLPEASAPAQSEREAPVAAPIPARPALVIEAEGVRLFDPATGSGRPIAFGAAQDDVLRALAFLGPHTLENVAECGAGPMDFASWPNGLQLHFQEARFVGWAADNSMLKRGAGPVTTAAGVGPGSTRKDLESAYSARIEETTLGMEFEAGGLFGVLDGDGPSDKIEVMWGGESCNFR
jgi:hypothetical protein